MPTSSTESFLGPEIFFFFARNIPDISFHLGIVTKDSIMANHTSCNISPSQKNSSSMHNLPAPLQSPQRERGKEEGGTGESASCLNKQIMPIHKGKWAFLESGPVQSSPGRGRQRLSQLPMQFVVVWISAGLS